MHFPWRKISDQGNFEHHAPDPDEPEGALADDRWILKFSLLCAAVIFSFFILFVYVYGEFGGPWVDGLDEQIGEIVAGRARRLEHARMIPAAITAYRQALELPFDDPRQRAWAMRSLGELLMQAGMLDEAVTMLVECKNAYGKDMTTHGLLCKAYQRLESPTDLLAAAETWLEVALTEIDQATAQYYKGSALLALGRREESRDAFTRGSTLVAESLNTYHAAVLNYEVGDRKNALSLFNEYLKTGRGWRKDKAETYREAIMEAQ